MVDSFFIIGVQIFPELLEASQQFKNSISDALVCGSNGALASCG
jgi:hypothetical protein